MNNQPITDYLTKTSAMLGAISVFDIARAVDILAKARMLKANVWLVGNGGSAATASHFANDLVKMARIKATSLADQTPTVLAYGNDNGWQNMFSDAMESLFAAGDVLIAISCSGRSKNVVNAARFALEMDGYLIVLTGEKKENMLTALNTSAVISVNSDDIQVVEDCHLAVCHAIARMLAGEKKTRIPDDV
jgi:D-sedoheptulose 7-phosphate isomerase